MARAVLIPSCPRVQVRVVNKARGVILTNVAFQWQLLSYASRLGLLRSNPLTLTAILTHIATIGSHVAAVWWVLMTPSQHWMRVSLT